MSDRIEGFGLIDEPAWKGQRSKYAPFFYACLDMPAGKSAVGICESDEKASQLADNLIHALRRCVKRDDSLRVLHVSKRDNAVCVFKDSI